MPVTILFVVRYAENIDIFICPLYNIRKGVEFIYETGIFEQGLS